MNFKLAITFLLLSFLPVGNTFAQVTSEFCRKLSATAEIQVSSCSDGITIGNKLLECAALEAREGNTTIGDIYFKLSQYIYSVGGIKTAKKPTPTDDDYCLKNSASDSRKFKAELLACVREIGESLPDQTKVLLLDRYENIQGDKVDQFINRVFYPQESCMGGEFDDLVETVSCITRTFEGEAYQEELLVLLDRVGTETALNFENKTMPTRKKERCGPYFKCLKTFHGHEHVHSPLIEKIEAKFNKLDLECSIRHYNVYMDYSRNAGEYNLNIHMGVTWPNVELRTISNEHKPQLITEDSYDNGEEIHPPYKFKVPYGTGEEIYYGFTSDDYGIPTVRYLYTALVGETRGYCAFNGAADSLNDLSFPYVERPFGGTYGSGVAGYHFHLGVDLLCGEDRDHLAVQYTIELEHNPLIYNPYIFYQEKASDDLISAINNGEDFTQSFSNGLGGKMTVRFEPIEKE